MVGNIVPRQTAEPIFREWLQEMDDRRLESEALTWIWLCETRKDGLWEEEVWRRDCVRSECERRERPEIFLQAQSRILMQLGKASRVANGF
jgi:hypothetical protein